MKNRNSELANASVLGDVFVVLKLTHVIDWSWLWVLAPFWIPFALMLVVLAILHVFMAIRCDP
jgi:hypothetical protein